MKIDEIKSNFDAELEKDHIDWDNIAILMRNLGNRIEELREYVKTVYEMKDLLSDISSMAAHWWENGREDEANLLETHVIMHQRILDGKEIHGIKNATDCIGKTLTKVEKLCSSELTVADKGVFQEGLILWFEDMPMVLNEYLDSVVNPYYTEEQTEQTRLADISAEFLKIIGSHVIKHHYTGSHTLQLHFDNGYILYFSNKMLFQVRQDNVAYYWISKSDDTVTLKPGITSGKLYIHDDIYPRKGWRYYYERTVFLQIGETIHRIYCNVKESQEGLYIEEVPGFACEKLPLSVEGKEFVFDSYGHQDGKVRDMFFACGEEILCLTCGYKCWVRMILLDKGSFDPANVKKEKGKEIHFVRE